MKKTSFNFIYRIKEEIKYEKILYYEKTKKNDIKKVKLIQPERLHI